MKLIDNLSEKLVDDLRVTMQRDSRVSIAAACFSVYAYRQPECRYPDDKLLA